MRYRFVTEPLDSPANVLQLLLKEIIHQTAVMANPIPDESMSNEEDPASWFEKKAHAVFECTKAIQNVRDEVLRRFQELEQKAKDAQQALDVAKINGNLQ